MKFLRGLYVYTMYILGAPWFMLVFTALSIYNIVYTIMNRLPMSSIFDGFKAIAEGYKDGHKHNKRFIKYGLKGCERSIYEID